MAKRTKVSMPGSNLPVPQDRDEAASAVAEIGTLNRKIGRVDAALSDQVAKLKEKAEAETAPLRERVTALTEGVRIWADANRVSLTGGGRTKTADLGTGTIAWRLRPPKVTIPKAKEKVAEIIAAARAMGFGRFVRITEEVNKEAMQAEPEVARTISGVKIGSAGEDFTIEPFEVVTTGGAS